MAFTQKFGSYVTPGDSITCEVDGFTVTARVERPMIRSNFLRETPRWRWDRHGLLVITRRIVFATGFYAHVYN